MSITVLTAADVSALLAHPDTLKDALASQREVLAAFSRSGNAKPDAATENAPSEIQIPHRTTLNTEGCTTLCMPSRVRGLEGEKGSQGTGIGVKVVSVPRQGDAGLPATTTLFEGKEGKLRAVVNARALTAVRNACGAVKDNTAIILIGSYKPTMHEIPGSVVAQGMTGGRKLVVDSREACLREAGELIDAHVAEDDVVELGDVLSGASVGGEGEGGVYIFKSVGISVQDVAIADVMLRLAEARGLGTVIPDYD
ncbi:hypothetical protein QFC19_001614 [Naganishia cerealis]|uniref:Uncharacterized protein n=1 Tax=Naganishia cerealis TaxID=610337 RepID=A0ACC2WG99_9TREE|nr:hypothetical protein QFC19_001614 [Naganishia cerealis]